MDNLRWEEGRWHCGSGPIHAGAQMELRGSNGTWLRVRIESRDQGVILVAHTHINGSEFERKLRHYDVLRWPAEKETF